MKDSTQDQIIDMIFAPIGWAFEETITFAVTGDLLDVYIVMGVCAYVICLLIRSMLPKKAMSQNIRPRVFTPYKGRIWAKQIRAEAKAS